ncbi:polyprenyl synthetase family protein [Oceanobacillus sojae]|uniref:polyprenyl synthetase family protein n=1 Tax=Oceanobacillus sojae TaxID=582851 RepID=UPI0021A2BF26|nr:polyprenyl synthetase family protein [Oceanobacillus sojae]MCT1904478.1 polyprenyl synthetase family protein [Oceanobacillus sojae]
MPVHPMWGPYPRLQSDLQSVLQVIESHLQIHDKRIEATIKELVYSGGKLLRPAYTLLCAQIGDASNHDKERSIAVAAALETLHMATLIHDDVIDEADFRHGAPTIHTQQGNQFAIYSGDYLFCVCFTILSKYARTLAHLEFNARSMEKILTGELDQLHARYQIGTSIKDYLARISGKTAQLFAVSCYSGAITSQATRRQTMLAWSMGHYIGMAFQIIDDVLDFKGDFNTVRKPTLADIRQGIYTLPLIYALREQPEKLSPYLNKKADLTDDELMEVLAIVERTKGIEKSKRLARKYIDKALKSLSKLPDGEYKETLYELTTMLLDRKM